MAYSAVPTVTTGYLWTASDHNTYIKDNFAAGVPDLFTTKGDLAVASAADTAGRLGVGTNNYILVADSAQTLGVKWGISPAQDLVTTKGDLLAATAADTLARVAVGSNGAFLIADSAQSAGIAWSSGSSYARYYRSTTQTISNDTVTIVDFASSDFDTDSAVTTGASWKYTVPTGKTGYYLVIASVVFDSSASWEQGELAYIRIFKNGGTNAFLDYRVMQGTGTYGFNLVGGTVISLAAADYIDVRVYQNSDASATISALGNGNHIAIARIF